MDTPTLAHDLESRGFTPFRALDDVASHVSSAYVRKGDVSDLVLVVDRTDPEAGPPDPMAPHRANRRMAPFSAPLEDVVRLARAAPTSFFGPLCRITVVEIATSPASPEDRQRLASYVTPKRGRALVGAIHVDVERKTLYANDGLAPSRTGMPKSDEPLRWFERLVGATVEVQGQGSNADPVALFGPRAVAVATFLASPIAGSALLGMNLHRTRRTGLGVALFSVTVLAMAFLAGVVSLGHGGAARGITPAVTFLGLFLFSRLARTLFGDPVRKASALLAVLLSVASVASLLVAVAVPMVAFEILSERETVTESGAKVIFDRTTTEQRARNVGALLEKRGVLVGPTSGAILRTEGTEHKVLLSFDDPHAHEAAGVEAFYRDVASELSASVFAGDLVLVIFQTELGTEFARMSSR